MFLVAAFVSFIAAYAEPPSPSTACPVRGGVPEYMMSHPDRLRVWMDSHSAKIKDAGDLICCLPHEYRRNVAIAPTSHAAQNGMPDSPRVILMNQLPRRGPFDPRAAPMALSMMLSINGGSSDLNQAQSVEMLSRNPRSGEAEYFDLEMGHSQGNMRAGAPPRAHLSRRNPQECMNCHGNAGSVPPGGPRVIFDPDFSWPRFVGGTLSCQKHEDAVMDRIERASFEAVRTNPRYRCVEIPSKFEDYVTQLRNRLFDMDIQLKQMNEQRVVKLVVATPEWRKVLPALIAREYCARSLSSFADYIPETAWGAMNGVSTLRPSLRGQGDLTAAYRAELEGQRRLDDVIRREQREWLAKPDLSRPPPIGETSVACENREPGGADVTEPSERRPGKDVSNKSAGEIETPSGRRILDAYSLDTHLEAFRFRAHERGFDSATRFLFESRGISTEGWTTDAIGGRYRRRVNLAGPLSAVLPVNDRLRQIHDQLAKDSDDAPSLCDELKRISHRELATIRGASATPSVAPTSGTKR